MFATVARYSSSSNSILSSATKMMNALLVERDWPAQEVMHHLLGLPLVESSRTVISINVRAPDQQNLILEIHDSSLQKRGKSWLEKLLEFRIMLWLEFRVMPWLRLRRVWPVRSCT